MMQEITFVCSPLSERQMQLFTDAAKGADDHGIKAHIEKDSARTKAVACWGWSRGKELREAGHDVLVFERGYLGDRFHWTSLAWNGLNGRGDFCLPEEVSEDRFTQNFAPLKPWKTSGDKIIIMGQVPGDKSLQGKDLTSWYESIANLYSLAYGAEVWFRPHPRGEELGRNFRPKLPKFTGSLEEALQQAFFVVTYNSNSAVDAVINGVPAASFDEGSMAWDVTSHAVYDKLTPDRTVWAKRLAHCQWSPEEITSGAFWERMRCRLEG